MAYCSQAVLEAAQRTPASEVRRAGVEAPFAADELRGYLLKASGAIRARTELPFQEIAASLEAIARQAQRHLEQLEDLERRLTALEEKLVAAVRALQSEEDLYSLREALDRELRPYRGKMSAEQLAMLEKRYLDTAMLDRSKLPRLSLFYLH